MIKKARTRVLMQSQIESAMRVTRSNRAAAEYLRVSYGLYKKYAKVYKNSAGVSLFDVHLNQAGRGMSKTSVSQKRFLLDDILLGKYPQYSREKLLRRMIVNGYIEESCSHCGFAQRRPTDLKTPLILNFINGNNTDFRRENLEVLCYNCYFILVGNISQRDLKHNAYDRPEEMVTIDSMMEDQEQAAALNSLEILTDEEKQELLSNLTRNL